MSLSNFLNYEYVPLCFSSKELYLFKSEFFFLLKKIGNLQRLHDIAFLSIFGQNRFFAEAVSSNFFLAFIEGKDMLRNE